MEINLSIEGTEALLGLLSEVEPAEVASAEEAQMSAVIEGARPPEMMAHHCDSAYTFNDQRRS